MSQNLDSLLASMKEANPVSPSKDADVTARLTRSQAAEASAMAIPPAQVAPENPPTTQPNATAKSTNPKKTKAAKPPAKNGSTSTIQKTPETAGKDLGGTQTNQLSALIGAKHVIDVDNPPEGEVQPSQLTDGPEKAKDELTAIMLEAALKAGRDGDQAKSDMYFNCYKALILGDSSTSSKGFVGDRATGVVCQMCFKYQIT
ncbi:hypothetical protein PTTG_26026 [Puccinia triticina 1-1 BBBD Race 1]|uniref:Uncharacterized protein n=1 Tax=Puccinia triticina (isolate 1-1 / race 1 (BBBD)) TaxID=630390 RepID=A0A180GX73_PUCT1|nr:hypothetical protein PTTG_26026 [Puccinia triticina 1-1 BBBD Race 1]